MAGVFPCLLPRLVDHWLSPCLDSSMKVANRTFTGRNLETWWLFVGNGGSLSALITGTLDSICLGHQDSTRQSS